MAPDAPGESEFSSGIRNSKPKVRVATVAGGQHGRIRYDQLTTLGIGKATISRWVDAGYLHRVLPRVYAVGHGARTPETDISAALLYAGPGAVLSHGTAIWWFGLLSYPPHELHLSTPRGVKSLDGVVVHGERYIERVVHKGFPVTTVSQALLDFSVIGADDLIRLALANADYQGSLDIAELNRHRKSAALKRALKIHLPELAHTRSEAERLMLTLCQDQGLPTPQCNVYVEGWLVDAFWPDAKLAVEIDGFDGHRTRAQLERDHQRDLELRRAGYTVLRYTWRQLRENARAVADELRRYL